METVCQVKKWKNIIPDYALGASAVWQDHGWQKLEDDAGFIDKVIKPSRLKAFAAMRLP